MVDFCVLDKNGRSFSICNRPSHRRLLETCTPYTIYHIPYTIHHTPYAVDPYTIHQSTMSALKAPSSSLPSAGPSSAATLADINLNDLRIEVPTVSREDGSDDDDDDAPPAFPAINSAQRSRPAASSSRPEQASSPSQSSTATSGSTSAKSSSLRAVLGVPASSLGAPSSRGASTGSGGLAVGGARGGLGVPPSTKSVTTRTRGKVALEPGHSPLDWARVKNSTDLRVSC